MFRFFRIIRQKLLAENKLSRYLLYAIGEIVLVVIGILIALQVNNWNNRRVEQARIEAYARSLVQDLKSDIEMLKVSQYQAEHKYHAIDSLRKYVNAIPYDELSNTDIFVLVHDVMYRPFIWSRSTLNELKSSGGMRYITNAELEKKLVAYESFSYHLDEDFVHDLSNAGKADVVTAEVLNMNTPYFSDFVILESERYNDPTLDLYTTDIYKDSKANDLELISDDPAQIDRLVNTYIFIQNNFRIRALIELPQIITDAEELIELLEEEYGE